MATSNLRAFRRCLQPALHHNSFLRNAYYRRTINRSFTTEYPLTPPVIPKQNYFVQIFIGYAFGSGVVAFLGFPDETLAYAQILFPSYQIPQRQQQSVSRSAVSVIATPTTPRFEAPPKLLEAIEELKEETKGVSDELLIKYEALKQDILDMALRIEEKERQTEQSNMEQVVNFIAMEETVEGTNRINLGRFCAGCSDGCQCPHCTGKQDIFFQV
eukprot:104390_1